MTRAHWTEPKGAPKQQERCFVPRRTLGKKQTAPVRESGYAAKSMKLVVRSFLLLEEHASHNVNLGALCIIHVGGEVEQDRIRAGSRRVEEILHHNQGARVVL